MQQKELEQSRSLLLTLRHPLRALAWAAAIAALGWGTLFSGGLLAAMSGAVVGVVAGEVLGRSRVRILAVFFCIASFFAISWWLADSLVQYPSIAYAVGPARALWWSSSLRYFVVALSFVATLRALSLRVAALHALELSVMIASLVALFAGHRDGVIARPLWLGDWAWRQGIDPTNILLYVGGAVILLAALLSLLETRSKNKESRISPVAWLFFPALAALAAWLMIDVELPTPKPDERLGLTQDEDSYGKSVQGTGKSGPPQPVKLDENGQPITPKLDQNGLPINPKDPGSDPSSGSSGGSPADPSQDPNGEPKSQPSGGAPPPQEPNLDDQESMSQQKPSPMAVIILGDDYSPPSEVYYFRQEVWSEYNGTRLVSSSRADADIDTLENFPSGSISMPAPFKEGRTEVHGTVALLVEHKKPFALETPSSFEPMPNPNRSRFLGAYRFTSMAQSIEYKNLVGKKAGDPAWSEELREYYTKAPTDDRYKVLALSLIGPLPEAKRADPFVRALAIKRYLDENMSYSTANRHAGVDDPTADFLFGDKIGYCVHMAHAAVFLFRSVGVPSRIGTGYAVKEEQRQGSTILLRSDSAHAWPEIYIEGMGWIILDITPLTNLDPPGEPVDQDLQRMLGEMARQEPPPNQEKKSESTFDWGGMFSLGLSSLLLGALLLLYSAKLWRRVIVYFASTKQLPRVGYRAALDLLSEAGLSRRFGETREAFARRLSERFPSLLPMTRHHMSARLGAPSEESMAFSASEWRGRLSALRAELRQQTKLWRRFIGLLYPLSFFRSK